MNCLQQFFEGSDGLVNAHGFLFDGWLHMTGNVKICTVFMDFIHADDSAHAFVILIILIPAVSVALVLGQKLTMIHP